MEAVKGQTSAGRTCSDSVGPQPQPKLAISFGGDLADAEQLPATLGEMFRATVARAQGKRIVHIGLDGSEFTQSYGELWHEAERILTGLRNRGLHPGDKILFQCDSSRDFLPAFWGAVMGGFVPVPVSVPSTYEASNSGVSKLKNAWQLLEQPLVLTCGRLAPAVSSLASLLGTSDWTVETVENLRENDPSTDPHPAGADDVTLMMLTSGSTGIPKGVMLRHRNLIARSAGSRQAHGFTPEEISLSWMPLDHVASLIYFHLRDVFIGCDQVHVAPGYILQNPLRWLDLIDRYRVAVTFAPNFAFGLVNEREAEMPGRAWDLSCVRMFLNGGEAVVPRTARRFMNLLEPKGLGPSVMRPAWGMSETSSGVAYGDRFTLATTADSDPFAEVGLPLPGVWFRIVNERDEPLEEGQIGRLQCNGVTIMAGYFQNDEANREAFTNDGWFRTGDLGLLRDGRLTITGREKNVIIINGVNFYSHEIESVAEQVSGVELSYTAACAVRDVEGAPERLALFFTPREGVAGVEVAKNLRMRVGQSFGIPPAYVIPLPKEEIPKTEIGKIQHAKLKKRFEAGEFQARIAAARTQTENSAELETPTSRQVAAIWREVLKVEAISPDSQFFELGGDSLRAFQIISRIREQFEVELPLSSIFDKAATVCGMADCIERARVGAAVMLPNVEPVPRDKPLLLSYPQQRIWLVDQLEGGTRYNVSRAAWLHGNLDIEALRHSLNEIVERHEMLRTTFGFSGGALTQTVTVPRPIPIPVEDLASLPKHERRACALGLAGEEAGKRFDLGRGPLLRAKLFRTEENEFLLAFCFHQIAVDGWSMGVLFEELSRIYEQRGVEGLQVQYADFAQWQRRWITEASVEKQLAYWKERLGGELPVLKWPADTAASGSARAKTERLVLSGETVAKIREFNRGEGTTLFMSLLTIFKALLHYYSRQEDILVGSAVSGRNRVEIEKLIGFFVNTVVLRTRVSPALSFRELLAQVRQAAVEAYANADAPFESVVNELNRGRANRRSGIFQAWFSFMDSMAEFKLGDVVAEPVHNPPPEAQFDLSLFVVEKPAEVDCYFEYKTDLFNRETILNIMQAFSFLLNEAISRPATSLGELLARVESNQQSFRDAGNGTIHQWIEQQAARNPAAIAVTCGEQVLTYDELNRRANRLARHLRKRGVAPETLVGICVERSADTLVGILGVLKAGGAYVPLDPNYPPQRLEYMLDEIAAPVLLAQEKTRAKLPSDAAVLTLDGDLEKLTHEPDTNLPPLATSNNLAYVIFTSGSTGKPKGVAVTHANLVFSTRARFAYYTEPVRGYLLISSFSFDSSVAGIFWTLCSGGKLVLPTDGQHQDPAALARIIEREQASHFLSLPSLYNLMLQQSDNARFASLRTVIVAGESCPKDLLQRHADVVPGSKLYNEYGPTEGTVWSTVAELKPNERVTIGKPIPGAQVYVVDGELNEVGRGEPGELLVGGPGVTRGYLNRPDVTAQRFLPDEFAAVKGGRLYRTGDLGRYLSDGNIEFLGRIDHQVKIRGFRIELEEIETVIREYPCVRDVAVVAETISDGNARLIGHVVAVPGHVLKARELRSFLETKLPDYMVPGALAFPEALPVTPNGKVDRNALLAMPVIDGSADDYVAPRGPVEERLAEIWKDVLRAERVGAEHNFFEAGGHSLLAIQVMARVRDAFDVELPLKVIFEKPTIAGLAEAIVETLLNSQIGALTRVEQMSDAEVRELLHRGAA